MAPAGAPAAARAAAGTAPAATARGAGAAAAAAVHAAVPSPGGCRAPPGVPQAPTVHNCTAGAGPPCQRQCWALHQRWHPIPQRWQLRGRGQHTRQPSSVAPAHPCPPGVSGRVGGRLRAQPPQCQCASVGQWGPQRPQSCRDPGQSWTLPQWACTLLPRGSLRAVAPCLATHGAGGQAQPAVPAALRHPAQHGVQSAAAGWPHGVCRWGCRGH